MPDGDFPTTHWSLLLKARGDDSLALRGAREELCTRYWQPLYVYARARGQRPENAEDLVQGFLERLLTDNRFLLADPDSGKFRTFLLTAFQRFIISDLRKDQAKKRGGNRELFSLDFETAERELGPLIQSGVESPERAFDRQWARTVVDLALRALEKSWDKPAKRELFSELKPFLTLDPADSLVAVAERLGKQAGSVRMSLSRLREEYRLIVYRTVADTLAPNADLDGEIDYLIGLLLDK